jgi:heme exporter protein B
MSSSFWRCFQAILEKDLKIESRNKETLATVTLFGVVLTFLFAFGFIGDPATNLAVTPGILWAALLFIGALSIGRTFAREQENSAFTALALSPAPRSAILAAKVLVNMVVMLGVMLVITPLLAILMHIDLSEYILGLTALLSLSAAGFALVGTPLAVMAVGARFPEVLLPMVVFPLVTPVMICGVRGAAALFGTSVDLDYLAWTHMILAFDLMIGVGGFFLFDWMVSE